MNAAETYETFHWASGMRYHPDPRGPIHPSGRASSRRGLLGPSAEELNLGATFEGANEAPQDGLPFDSAPASRSPG